MPGNRHTEGEGNHSLPQILESAHSATCQKHIQSFITQLVYKYDLLVQGMLSWEFTRKSGSDGWRWRKGGGQGESVTTERKEQMPMKKGRRMDMWGKDCVEQSSIDEGVAAGDGEDRVQPPRSWRKQSKSDMMWTTTVLLLLLPHLLSSTVCMICMS